MSKPVDQPTAIDRAARLDAQAAAAATFSDAQALSFRADALRRGAVASFRGWGVPLLRN